jgi:hypothetical protein
VGAAAAAAAIAPIKEYTVPLTTEYTITKIISVGDTVPETSDPSKQYQMVGIPDGLGAHANPDGTTTVFTNHELTSGTLSEAVLGQPLNRGAFVSKLTLDAEGNVLSGERAYDWIFHENVFHGPAPEVGNATRAFSRFCSGDLAGPEHGFDRFVYLTNEEEGTPANSHDGLGGLAVAIVDNALYTLPKLGRFAWENTLAQPLRGNRTLIMSMEDGPAALDPGVENSQLYVYVGKKQRSPGAGVLRRNGLDNGKLYVFRSKDGTKNSELTFENGTLEGEWVEIPGAEFMSEAELEAASDAVGAMTFARPEDGAFNDRQPNEFFFVTTGGAAGANELGRLYSLRLGDFPNATLTVVYNADEVVDAGGDIAISPDNMDVSGQYLMINEDGTAESRVVMDAKARDGSIWRFRIVNGKPGVDVSSATRVAELDPPGRDGVAVGPGIWETSGIIDMSHIWGRNSWLFDVQAHPPTAAAGSNTVEDGQLLIMVPAL